MGEGIRARIARPFVFVMAGAAVLGVIVLMALLYESTTIACDRARGEEGVCVVTQRRLAGTSVRRLPASTIRNATIDVSISRRSGSSQSHVDTIFTLELADGPPIKVDDVAFAFLDPSFDRADAQDIDRFIADKTIEHTYAKNGGLWSALAIIGLLVAFVGSLAWLWGFASIEITLDGDTLVVKGDEVSRHARDGITNVGIDEAYHSLRVHYHDGTSRQTARLGVPVPRLEELARRTRALLGLA